MLMPRVGGIAVNPDERIKVQSNAVPSVNKHDTSQQFFLAMKNKLPLVFLAKYSEALLSRLAPRWFGGVFSLTREKARPPETAFVCSACRLRCNRDVFVEIRYARLEIED